MVGEQMGNRSAITLALTGASGAPYALRLLQCLTLHYEKIYLLLSAPARVVLATECDIALPDNTREQLNRLSERLQLPSEKIELLARDNWMSAVASGSSAPKQMVVCPCSTGTLSAIAQGASDNLIERAADVVLKEKGQLILVPRETPYSAIHLENMLNLARLGVTILPASPGFYQQPKTVDDLVDFIVARILDHLGIEQTLMPRWGYGNGEN
nr:flavin prenyltransferase UbiX [Permianibacter aggregans]